MTKVLIYRISPLKITVLYRMCVCLDKSDWSVFNCQCCSVPRPGAEVKANEIDQLDGGTRLIAHAYWDCCFFLFCFFIFMKPFCPSFATLMIMYFSSWCMKKGISFFFPLHFLLLSGSLSVRSGQTFRLRILGHNSDVADNFSRWSWVLCIRETVSCFGRVHRSCATDMTVKGSCVLADFQALEALMPL